MTFSPPRPSAAPSCPARSDAPTGAAAAGGPAWAAEPAPGDPFAPHAAGSLAAEALRQLAALPFFKAGAWVDVTDADSTLPLGVRHATLTGAARIGSALQRAELSLPPLLLEHARVLPQLLVSEGEWHACCLRGQGGSGRPGTPRALLVLQALRELGEAERQVMDLFVRNLVKAFGGASEQGSLLSRPMPPGALEQLSVPASSRGGAKES